jgi:hypothetical protein
MPSDSSVSTSSAVSLRHCATCQIRQHRHHHPQPKRSLKNESYIFFLCLDDPKRMLPGRRRSCFCRCHAFVGFCQRPAPRSSLGPPLVNLSMSDLMCLRERERENETGTYEPALRPLLQPCPAQSCDRCARIRVGRRLRRRRHWESNATPMLESREMDMYIASPH